MAFVATAGTASSAAVAALGRFHAGSKDQPVFTSGRQRSSSLTSRYQPNLQHLSSSPSPLSSSAVSSPAPELLSRRYGLSTDAQGSSTHQHQHHQEHTVPQRDLSAHLPSPVYSQSANATPAGRAHHQLEDGFDRINLVPRPASPDQGFNHCNPTLASSRLASPTDRNTDNAAQAPGSVPTICTGRARSNTIGSITSSDPALPSILNQFHQTMRPRRSSLVGRPTGLVIPSSPSSASPSIVLPSVNSVAMHTSPILPQYSENLESKEAVGSARRSHTPWNSIHLGFASRIILLIGIFCLSLGGLYLLAQVLPPLSLPKSIDDVKVDAAILQEFATATYEGWIRTFWVFSAVYIWKQCFGIPGSAFLNILAGALYGPWFGTFLTSLLTTVGSVLAYFMSFFLMEPIMNRYASGRLDQMRHQIQKRAMRSSGRKASVSSSTATSTAVQATISSSTPIIATTIPDNGPATPRASIRTRSSSFTIRRADAVEQDSHVSQMPLGLNSAAFQHNQETDIQESERLLEDKNVDHSTLSIDQLEENGKPEVPAEDDDDDDSEGTSLFMQLLLIRLFPLTPYWFINLASPLVGVPVVPFMTSMFLGVMPYNYICAQAGAILSEIHELRDIYQQPWILFQVVFVLVLCTFAVWLSKRSKSKQLDKEQRKSRTSEDERVDDDESTHHLLRSTHEDADLEADAHQHDRQTQQENIPMSPMDPQFLRPSGTLKRDTAVVDMSSYRY